MFEETARDTGTMDMQANNQANIKGYADGAPKAPEVHRAMQEIADLLNDTCTLIHCVGNAADRISGPVPSEVGAPDKTVGAQTLMAKLSVAYAFILRMNSDLRAHVERIEKTV